MKVKLGYLVFLIFWTLAPVAAQVVRTEPPFPTADGEVTIILQTEFGNGGLKNCSCDVYLHTGVITAQSTGPADWKYVRGEWGKNIPELKMDKTGPNSFSFTFTPRTFYGVPANEDIQQLAFVFRNVDGSKAARASDGGDIFIEVFSASDQLLTLLEQPAEDVFIKTEGQTIPIVAYTSAPSFFRIIDNGVTSFSTAEKLLKLEYDLVSNNSALIHDVDIVVDSENEVDTLFFQYYTLTNSPVADPLVDTKAGATLLNDTTVRLKLIAPGKSNVFVLTQSNSFSIEENFMMKRAVNGEYFWIDLSVGADQDWLLYQYLVDGEITIADPYAEVILDPFNDGAIDNDYFPHYPEVDAAGFITAYKIDGHEFDWTDQDYQRPDEPELVIYELLVRDFIASHSYQDLKDTLSYLRYLGINAIELMPVQEFENNNSWGYNPSFHMALDKYYGDPLDFKAFVNAAHEMGIAVILDVVYNHAFGQSPLAALYWDAASNRPGPDNPWLNPQARHPFNVGYDFNHESVFTKAFVKQVSEFWLEEYHIDGFRFDLSKGFTQKNNPNDVGAWGNYDASRIAIWKEYGDFIRSIDPHALLILEHFADNEEEKELSSYGFMLWGNSNHNFNEATMGFHNGGSSSLNWALYTLRGWSEPHLVSYMESHDEERLMYKNLQFGNSNGDYSVKELSTGLVRQKLANVFYWLLPGPRMIWQFGELGYDFSINRCQNGSISENCRLDKKPIRWDYFSQLERRDLYEHIASLIELRDSFDLATAEVVEHDLVGPVKQIVLRQGEFSLVAVGNFDVVGRGLSLDLPGGGNYIELYSGEMVSSNSVSLELPPGAFRIYANQSFELTSLEEVLLSEAEVKVFPNPTRSELTIVPDPEVQIERIELFDLSGRSCNRAIIRQNRLDIRHLPPGMYVMRIFTNQGMAIRKVFKN